MNLQMIISNPYFSISGWLISAVSLLYAIYQGDKRKKCEDKLRIQITKTKQQNTSVTAKDQATIIKDSQGNIEINHK